MSSIYGNRHRANKRVSVNPTKKEEEKCRWLLFGLFPFQRVNQSAREFGIEAVRVSVCLSVELMAAFSIIGVASTVTLFFSERPAMPSDAFLAVIIFFLEHFRSACYYCGRRRIVRF